MARKRALARESLVGGRLARAQTAACLGLQLLQMSGWLGGGSSRCAGDAV